MAMPAESTMNGSAISESPSAFLPFSRFMDWMLLAKARMLIERRRIIAAHRSPQYGERQELVILSPEPR